MMQAAGCQGNTRLQHGKPQRWCSPDTLCSSMQHVRWSLSCCEAGTATGRVHRYQWGMSDVYDLTTPVLQPHDQLQH